MEFMNHINCHFFLWQFNVKNTKRNINLVVFDLNFHINLLLRCWSRGLTGF